MAKKPNRYDTPLLHQVEAATELLRQVDAWTWTWWLAGTMPFVCAILHFWTDMSRAADAWSRLPTASLIVAILYCWMKIAHCVFADHLLRHLKGDVAPAAMPLRAKLRFVTSQALIHCTTPWLLTLAFLAMMPFGWAYAFYHNVSVLALTHFRANGRTRELVRKALVQSHFQPGQNHGVMLVLFVFSCLVWLNWMAGVFSLAVLARTFTGDDNAITRNPMTLLTSTMFAATMAASYVFVGPFVKALYALRCFHGESRKNGEDILVAFRRSAAPALALLLCFLSISSAHAQTAPASAPAPAQQQTAVKTPDPAALGTHIREVLEQDAFQWRMPRDNTDHKDAPKGWFSGFLDMMNNWIKGVIQSASDFFDHWIKEKIKHMLRGFKSKGDLGNSDSVSSWAASAHTVMVVLLVALGVILVVLLVRQWLKMPPAPAKAEAALPEINLESDHVIASQLPENEWLKLAQEKIDNGEYRLALRALFLATLSHLGDRRLLAIARSKSNGDYVRELTLRARDRTEMRGHFSTNVRTFDWAWYGWHDVTRDMLEQFRSNHQHIVSDGNPR